ncbi:Cyanovirin-N [Mycena sanguinolenta]|nr:Cyanovirin-N [Mycena sanguinolenta]
MTFSSTSQHYRLVGTILHAQCQDRHGNLHNTELDLNHLLGNNDGQFDLGGRHFHESSGICGLNGTFLVATLRRQDGGYRDALIDLNEFVGNDNGRLARV